MQAMGGQKNASSDPDGVSRRHQSQHQHRSPHGTDAALAARLGRYEISLLIARYPVADLELSSDLSAEAGR